MVLTPGTYHYFCAIPGHGQMTGLLVVTGGGEDTTAPEVSAQVAGERDGDGNYIGAATVTLNATDADSGVARVEYALDGGPFGTYSAPVTVNGPGAHTVRFRATDVAGNTSEIGSTQFTVVGPTTDTTPPTVTAAVDGDQDENGAYVGTATVTVTATDTGSGVATVEYSLDGGAFTAYTAPVTINSPGQHTVQYRATDEAGNTSSPQSVAVRGGRRARPGQHRARGDRHGGRRARRRGRLRGHRDGHRRRHRRGFRRRDGRILARRRAVRGLHRPVVVNQPGVHTLSARATDEAGNTSEPETVTFTVVEDPAGHHRTDRDRRGHR